MSLGQWGGSEVQGPRVPGSTGAESVKSLTSAAEELLEGPEGSYTVGRVKIGSFTRDLTAAAGDQDITGLGGTPFAVFVQGVVAAEAGKMSSGYSDADPAAVAADNNDNCIWDRHNTGADAWDHVTQSRSIYADQGATDFSRGFIIGISDGFRITWDKTGAPTGTWQGKYMAFLRG